MAAGESLPFKQEDIHLEGAAIECRINAEDPSKNFFPSTGEVKYLYVPVGNLGMRMDTALYAGCNISPFYDSMIAKLIGLGHDRNEAIEKVKRLLDEMVISGITTNQKFYLSLLEDEEFKKGTITTDYVERVFLPEWKRRESNAAV